MHELLFSGQDESGRGYGRFLTPPARMPKGVAGAKAALPPGSPDPSKAGEAFREHAAAPGAVLRGEGAPPEPETGRRLTPERLIGERNFLPAVFLRQGAERSNAVCFIKVAPGETDRSGVRWRDGWFGTGFLVAPGLLLTNHHVLNSAAVAKLACCRFSFRHGPDGEPEEHHDFRLQPERLFLASPFDGGLDYCFVAIDEAASERFGHLVMDRRFYSMGAGDRANVVQHPNGRPQEVVLQDNRVEAIDDKVLHYLSDTEGGSSGSPVFDNRWALVALHHASLRVGDGYVNEGVKLSAIAADLERRAGSADPAEARMAARVLGAFEGIDSGLGLLGAAGRSASGAPEKAAEAVSQLYRGSDEDLDGGYWRLDWCTEEAHLDRVALTVADFNLDLWIFAGLARGKVVAIQDRLREGYGQGFDVAFADDAAVLWNRERVEAASVMPGPGLGLFLFGLANRGAEGEGGAARHRLLLALLERADATSLRRAVAALDLILTRDPGAGDPLLVGAFDPAEALALLPKALGGKLRGHALKPKDAGLFGGAVVAKAPGSRLQAVFTGPGTEPLDPDDPLIAPAAAKGLPPHAVAEPAVPPLVLRLSTSGAGGDAPREAGDFGPVLGVSADRVERRVAELFPDRAPARATPARTFEEAPVSPISDARTIQSDPNEFLRRLAEGEATPAELRAVAKVDESLSRPFEPVVTVDWEKVYARSGQPVPEGALALNSLNGLARRWRDRRYRHAIKTNPGMPRLVSEGDSWFQFPVLLEDTIDHLSDSFAIRSLGAAGDVLSNMMAEDELTRAVEDERPSAVLLSAGGNDVLGGGNLAALLHPFERGREAADYPNRLYDAGEDKLRVTLRRMLTRLFERFPELPVFMHGYDHALPNAGRWLGEPMRRIGVEDEGLQRDVIRVLIDRYAGVLEGLEREFAGKFVFVDCRRAVGKADDWHDELHPNKNGYGRVAARFKAAIDRRLGLNRSSASPESGSNVVKLGASPPPVATEPTFEAFIESLGLRHFRAYEFLIKGDSHFNSQSPAYGLNTDPPRIHWENIRQTALALDELRSRLGRPIVFNSVYRSPAYNAAIGGARNSQHARFSAVDFVVQGSPVGPAEWASALQQIRGEGVFAGGIGVYRTFVHVDSRGQNVDWFGS